VGAVMSRPRNIVKGRMTEFVAQVSTLVDQASCLLEMMGWLACDEFVLDHQLCCPQIGHSVQVETGVSI